MDTCPLCRWQPTTRFCSTGQPPDQAPMPAVSPTIESNEQRPMPAPLSHPTRSQCRGRTVHPPDRVSVQGPDGSALSPEVGAHGAPIVCVCWDPRLGRKGAPCRAAGVQGLQLMASIPQCRVGRNCAGMRSTCPPRRQSTYVYSRLPAAFKLKDEACLGFTLAVTPWPRSPPVPINVGAPSPVGTACSLPI